MRKMRISTVLAHPACAHIDAAIARGEPILIVSRRFGVTKQAVNRRRTALRKDYGDYLAAIGRLTTNKA